MVSARSLLPLRLCRIKKEREAAEETMGSKSHGATLAKGFTRLRGGRGDEVV